MKKIKHHLRPSFKLKYFTALILVALLNTSETFSQRFYIADAGIHSELMSKRHDSEIGILVPDEEQGFKYTLAYSPINHLGIHLGIVSADNRLSENSDDETNGRLTSIAISSYHAIPKPTSRNPEVIGNILMNINLGYSRGQIEQKLSYLQTDFGFQKIFTQIGFGYTQKIWGAALFFKLNRVSYLEGDVTFSQLDFIGLPRAIDKIESKGSFNTFEYKLHIYIGCKYGKFVLGSTTERGLGQNLGFLSNSTSHIGIAFNIDDIINRMSNRKKR